MSRRGVYADDGGADRRRRGGAGVSSEDAVPARWAAVDASVYGSQRTLDWRPGPRRTPEPPAASGDPEPAQRREGSTSAVRLLGMWDLPSGAYAIPNVALSSLGSLNHLVGTHTGKAAHDFPNPRAGVDRTRGVRPLHRHDAGRGGWIEPWGARSSSSAINGVPLIDCDGDGARLPGGPAVPMAFRRTRGRRRAMPHTGHGRLRYTKLRDAPKG